MRKLYFVLIDIYTFSALVTMVDGLRYPTGSQAFGMIIGGAMFGLTSLAVSPILKFFKFPQNFWGNFLMGSVLNFVLFFAFSSGFFPNVLLISKGVFGNGFTPINLFRLELSTGIMVALVAAILGTLLQILTKHLRKQ